MANKSTSKSAGGIQDPEAGKIILNLFSKLDSNDIDGSIVSMKKDTLSKVKGLGASTSFQDWQRVKEMIEDYGSDQAISSAVYDDFHTHVEKKISGVRLSKLIGDRSKGLYSEFMKTDDKGEKVYNVLETSSTKKSKMIAKINKKFDKIEQDCVSLYTELANREGL